jgi:hypothetical protein
LSIAFWQKNCGILLNDSAWWAQWLDKDCAFCESFVAVNLKTPDFGTCVPQGVTINMISLVPRSSDDG